MPKPQYGWEHRARRKAWEAELRRLGSVPCRCGCGAVINDGDPWDLGHGVAVAHGGDGTDSAPEVPGHNRAGGAAITNAAALGASRDWW